MRKIEEAYNEVVHLKDNLEKVIEILSLAENLGENVFAMSRSGALEDVTEKMIFVAYFKAAKGLSECSKVATSIAENWGENPVDRKECERKERLEELDKILSEYGL